MARLPREVWLMLTRTVTCSTRRLLEPRSKVRVMPVALLSGMVGGVRLGRDGGGGGAEVRPGGGGADGGGGVDEAGAEFVIEMVASGIGGPVGVGGADLERRTR